MVACDGTCLLQRSQRSPVRRATGMHCTNPPERCGTRHPHANSSATLGRDAPAGDPFWEWIPRRRTSATPCSPASTRTRRRRRDTSTASIAARIARAPSGATAAAPAEHPGQRDPAQPERAWTGVRGHRLGAVFHRPHRRGHAGLVALRRRPAFGYGVGPRDRPRCDHPRDLHTLAWRLRLALATGGDQRRSRAHSQHARPAIIPPDPSASDQAALHRR